MMSVFVQVEDRSSGSFQRVVTEPNGWPRIAFALVVWLLTGGTAAAAPVQGELDSTLQRCGQMSSVEARIDCLEAALSAAYDEPAVAMPGPADGESATPFQPETAESIVLGAEQVASRERTRQIDSPERMQAQIMEHTIVGYRTLQIQLDNGQVWHQLKGDTQRLRLPHDQKLTAEIWQSRFGGYQMRIEEIGRTIRVERLR